MRRIPSDALLTAAAVLILAAFIAATVAIADAAPRCGDRQYRCWKQAWRNLPSDTRRYVLAVEWCETRRRNIHSPDGVHHGRLQFNLNTAWAAGFKRDPHLTSRFQQRVRAVRFARRHGWGHWSCAR